MPKASALGAALFEGVPDAGPRLCCRRRIRRGRRPEDSHQQWVWANIKAIAQLVKAIVVVFDCYVNFFDNGVIA